MNGNVNVGSDFWEGISRLHCRWVKAGVLDHYLLVTFVPGIYDLKPSVLSLQMRTFISSKESLCSSLSAVWKSPSRSLNQHSHHIVVSQPMISKIDNHVTFG